jgi:predicted dehydrogenase
MIHHPEINVLFILRPRDQFLLPLFEFLKTIPRCRLKTAPALSENIEPCDVIVTAEFPDFLEDVVLQGGAALGFFTGNAAAVPRCMGVKPEPIGPPCELRLHLENRSDQLWDRLPDAMYVNGNGWKLEKTTREVQTILYADWHYTRIPVVTSLCFGSGHCAAAVIEDLNHPVLLRILHRLILHLAGIRMPEQSLGVGILGYAPSVGKLHGVGVTSTTGLRLAAVCDVNPERRHAAIRDFPQVRIHEDLKTLAADPELEVVIVATPPSTHAECCIAMMEAGKHVVCEKPLAISSTEADRLAAAALRNWVHLGCHQNRRFDADYLTIRSVIAADAIGEVFHMETFVGGFHHPCGYWHSHEPVSGGTAFDWGAHYLDWIVSLIPENIWSVSGICHKRVWHDVTNSDQESVRIRFSGGQFAEFIHSDIAAFRKPKWYLLGTKGAIIARWRDVTEFEIDPLLYFRRHDIPATEMPPEIVVRRWSGQGAVVEEKPHLEVLPPFAFHRNLADHLCFGEPVAAPLSDSIQVVKILDAAARSAKAGGAEVFFDE